MISHAVVIAGAGPTGLMLAGELALAGVDVAIVEQRAGQELVGVRARGLHARTIEVLDQRGIAERFLAAGKIAQVAGFAWNPLDISDLPTRHPYGLALWQIHVERLLAEWVAELAVPIYRGREIVGATQDDLGVDLALADGESMRGRYVVGCDGGSSAIRKAAGIEFSGWAATVSCLIAEVELSAEPPWGLHRDARGVHSFSKLDKGVNVMVTEPAADATSEPTLADLAAALRAAFGSDFGVHSPTSIGRFTDMARQAAAYRERRIFVAGDAAHVHHPVGGQGLNIGVQDAVNLGWKLARVLAGAPDALLDSYHAERHPIAARVLRNTLAQVAILHRADDRSNALRDVVAELLRMDEPRRRFGAMMAGLDIRYELGDGHPLVGRRMPDLELDGGRVYALLHRARPLLLDFTGATFEVAVDVVRATYRGAWELPLVGAVAAPPAVLIRPDGYVAWAGEAGDPRLAEATAMWFA